MLSMLDSKLGGWKMIAVSSGNVADVDVRISDNFIKISVRFLEFEILSEFVGQTLVVVLANSIDLDKLNKQLVITLDNFSTNQNDKPRAHALDCSLKW